MRNFITFLFGLLTFSGFAQTTQTIDLKWKIGEKEKVRYSTVMSDIDTSKIEMNLGSLFKSFSDSSGKGLSETKDMFKKLNQALQNIDYMTTLTNKGNGIIDIIMTSKPKKETKEISKDTTDSKVEVLLKLMQTMNQGVVLRGSVYATGGIHSFWVKSNQKNLIATLFELPAKPVKIGDSWKLDANFIANDQNFNCDSSYKINEVTLADIKTYNGETIAVIKYNIIEYVNGTFNSPIFMGSGGEQKTMMKFSHQAIAEFSVDKGRWISYDGIMSLDATGVMTAKTKTKFTLISE